MGREGEGLKKKKREKFFLGNGSRQRQSELQQDLRDGGNHGGVGTRGHPPQPPFFPRINSPRFKMKHIVSQREKKGKKSRENCASSQSGFWGGIVFGIEGKKNSRHSRLVKKNRKGGGGGEEKAFNSRPGARVLPVLNVAEAKIPRRGWKNAENSTNETGGGGRKKWEREEGEG